MTVWRDLACAPFVPVSMLLEHMISFVSPRHLLRLAPIVVIALGCSDVAGKISAPSDNPVGTWVVKSVNSQPLPVALYSVGGKTTALTDETLVLRFDRTYAMTSTTRTAPNGTSVASASPNVAIDMGGWDLTSGDLTVGVASAILSGNTLTVRWSSAVTSSYQRQ